MNTPNPAQRVAELLAEARQLAEVEYQRTQPGTALAVTWAGVVEEIDAARRTLREVDASGDVAA